jgi:hypothetical protein
LLIIPVQAHSRNILPRDILLSIDGDSMVDDVGGTGTLTANLKALLATNWNIKDFSVGGSTVTGANSITARESNVDATYSKKNQRNELLIWIGTNDGCPKATRRRPRLASSRPTC